MPEFDGNPSKNQVFKAHYNGPPRNASVHAGLFCRGPVGSIHFFPTTTAGAASSSLHDDGVCFLNNLSFFEINREHRDKDSEFSFYAAMMKKSKTNFNQKFQKHTFNGKWSFF